MNQLEDPISSILGNYVFTVCLVASNLFGPFARNPGRVVGWEDSDPHLRKKQPFRYDRSIFLRTDEFLGIENEILLLNIRILVIFVLILNFL